MFFRVLSYVHVSACLRKAIITRNNIVVHTTLEHTRDVYAHSRKIFSLFFVLIIRLIALPPLDDGSKWSAHSRSKFIAIYRDISNCSISLYPVKYAVNFLADT